MRIFLTIALVTFLCGKPAQAKGFSSPYQVEVVFNSNPSKSVAIEMERIEAGSFIKYQYVTCEADLGWHPYMSTKGNAPSLTIDGDPYSIDYGNASYSHGDFLYYFNDVNFADLQSCQTNNVNRYSNLRSIRVTFTKDENLFPDPKNLYSISWDLESDEVKIFQSSEQGHLIEIGHGKVIKYYFNWPWNWSKSNSYSFDH